MVSGYLKSSRRLGRYNALGSHRTFVERFRVKCAHHWSRFYLLLCCVQNILCDQTNKHLGIKHLDVSIHDMHDISLQSSNDWPIDQAPPKSITGWRDSITEYVRHIPWNMHTVQLCCVWRDPFIASQRIHAMSSSILSKIALQAMGNRVNSNKQGKSEGFDSCDWPNNLKLDSNRQFFHLCDHEIW